MSGLEFMDLTRLIPRGACVYAVGFLLTDEELLALAVYRRVEQWELEAGGPPFALDQYFRKTKQNLSIVWTDRYRYRDRQEGGRVKDFNVLVVKTDVVWDDEPEPRLNKAVFKEHHFEILFPKNFIQTEGKGTGTKFTFEDMRHRLVCMPWPDYQCSTLHLTLSLLSLSYTSR